MQQAIDLTIVGGGSTAISFLAQFVNELEQAPARQTLQVVVFEPAPEIGPGEPYGADLSTNLLNIPAGKMFAYAQDRGHFFKWIQNAAPSVLQRYGVREPDPGAFLPRPLFGAYLRDVWRGIGTRARRLGMQIDHVQARVIGIQFDPASGPVWLETPHSRYAAQQVVLCNGNLPPVSYEALRSCKEYFNTPYPVAGLVRQVPSNARVGVIGSSLSAIDAVVALKESGHGGPIVAVSRSGRLPAVRATLAPSSPVTAPSAQEIAALVACKAQGLTLEALFGMLTGRLAAAGDTLDLADIMGYAGDAIDALGREIAASSTRPRTWQAIAISLNESIEHAWRLMRGAERRRFHTEWRAMWMTRRATFPMVNALKIKRYLDEGALRIMAGPRGVGINPVADGFDICIDGAHGAMQSCRVDYIVNATGMSTDVATSKDPLIQSLLAQGIAQADPYGGFSLDFDSGCLLRPGGAVVERISVLGSLAVGTYFWTMSLDVNARLALGQARRIAQEVLARNMATHI